MNCIAIVLESRSGKQTVYAIHGDIALHALTNTSRDERVWQWSPDGRTTEIREWLIDVTAAAEELGGRLFGDPVEFDLSLDAIAQVQSWDPGEWIFAPLLRKELLAAVADPSIFSHTSWGKAFGPTPIAFSTSVPVAPSAGDMYYDTADGLLRVYNGTSWSHMKMANSSTIGIETT